MSPKEGSGAPWSGSNGGGEFGEELKRAHEHQNSKMAAESAAAAGAAAAAAAGGMAAASAATNSTTSASADDSVRHDSAAAVAAAGGETAVPVPELTAAKESAKPTIADEPVAVVVPEQETDHVSRDVGGGEEDAAAAADAAATAPPAENEEEEIGEQVEVEESDDLAAAEEAMPELEPGKVRVRALYDYDATQDGDLSFVAGDMIITDGGAFSGDGWVSGTCHGNTGIFPANYTEPW